MKQRLTIEEYKAFLKRPVRKTNGKRGDKAKANMGWVIIDLARRLGLTTIAEYRFNPDRKWRADFALFGEHNGKQVKILVEYEGIFSEKSRHTTAKGYSADSDKYRSAAILGWTVLRYTAKNYEQLTVDLRKIINQ